ncbi:MAG TPA: hypothetical protein VFO29_04690 [Candidatus Rubrimentiphilum sp.]|nr:hypothetical protein [Candidatus Rubrimentiphilum sp.]
MRILLTAGAFAVAALFIPQPALAAMCGSPGDVTAVATRTVYNYNATAAKGATKIDKTYIASIAILTTYAEVSLDFPAGPIWQYWIKKSGNWTYAGMLQAPKGWPTSVAPKLDKMSMFRSNGTNQCQNPNWKNRSSSG